LLPPFLRSLDLLGLDLSDPLFYSGEFFLELVFIFFQAFQFFWCRNETPEGPTASTATTAAVTSPISKSPLASSWLTHFHHLLSV